MGNENSRPISIRKKIAALAKKAKNLTRAMRKSEEWKNVPLYTPVDIWKIYSAPVDIAPGMIMGKGFIKRLTFGELSWWRENGTELILSPKWTCGELVQIFVPQNKYYILTKEEWEEMSRKLPRLSDTEYLKKCEELRETRQILLKHLNSLTKPFIDAKNFIHTLRSSVSP